MADHYATSPNHTHLSTPVNAVDTYKLKSNDSHDFQRFFPYKAAIKIERIIEG